MADGYFGLAGVAVGSLLTWFVNHQQANRTADVARRDKWTNELILLVSELAGKCTTLSTLLSAGAGYNDQTLKALWEMNALCCRLALILHPGVEAQAEVLTLVSAVAKKTLDREEDARPLANLVQKLLNATRVITCRHNGWNWV
ncbi:MAG: hypothetical protein QOF48_3321 [Verrucomicrobiota bacterium]|jgi:hypothetical protein